MNKFFKTITNTNGDSLPFYRARVLDSGGSVVTIYSDAGGTRFTDSAGDNVNYATANDEGLVEFYWTAASSQTLQFLDTVGNVVKPIADFANNFSDPEVSINVDAVLGVNAADGSLGIFNGSTISDDQAVKDALQDVETAHENITERLSFQTVALMLASTQSAIGTGTIWRAGGFTYKESASDASDHHLTTAGSVKLYVQPNQAGEYALTAFGDVSASTASENNTLIELAFGALPTNGRLVFDYEGEIVFDDITLSTNGVTVHIPEGCDLHQTTLAAFGWKITGDDCSIVGRGAISADVNSLGDYATTGSGITRAIVHITGDRFKGKDIAVNTPSRCGLFFDNCSPPTLLRLRGDGGYAYADYNSASTLSLFLAYYDAPPGDSGPANIIGWEDVKNYISPFASGNLSGGAGTYQPIVTNCSFEDCYDHALYLLQTRDAQITNISTIDCRKPIAIDGDGGQIANCTLIATGTTQSNHEIGISLRTVSNASVINCRLKGIGAYIDATNATADDMENIEIAGNRLEATAASTELNAAVRVTNTSDQLDGVKIAGNRIISQNGVSASQGAIIVSGNATHQATDCLIEGNEIRLNDAIFGLYSRYTDDLRHSNNTYNRSGYDAGSAATIDMAFFQNANRIHSKGNTYRYGTGGSNVTSRGTNFAATVTDGIIEGERNLMTSGSLTAATLVVDNGTDTQKVFNHYDVTQPLRGTFTFPSGTTGYFLSTNNVQSHSDVQFSALDSGAADIFALGLYGEIQAASDRIFYQTDGTSSSGTGLVSYSISG